VENNAKAPKSNERDWEASFKGLQKTVQTQSEEMTGIKTLLSEISNKFPAAEEENNEGAPPATVEEQMLLLSGKIDQMTTDLQTSQAAATQQAQDNRKLQLLSESPEVLPFAASIPTLADETQQKAAIDAFANQLNAFAEGQKKPKPTAPPAAPPPPQTPPVDAITKAETAQAAWMKGIEDGKPDAEIEALRSDFFKANDKSGFMGDNWAFKED